MCDTNTHLVPLLAETRYNTCSDKLIQVFTGCIQKQICNAADSKMRAADTKMGEQCIECVEINELLDAELKTEVKEPH